MSGRHRDAAILCALVGLIGLPFLDKPFHIDDPFILNIAGKVLDDPLSPFAGYSAWFGQPDPVWKMATNPPLLSYYLAPFAALSDYSEVVLHAALLPFLLLLGGSALWLGRRFTRSPWLALFFVMTSTGVVVSGNVMRDVPTAALFAASLALCVAGCDRDRAAFVVLAGLSAGLAVLMKYSAIVLVPLLVLLPLLRGRLLAMGSGLVPLLLLGLWSLHNQLVYGETQVGLLLTRPWGPLRSWQDNLCGVPVVAGSLLYLAPALLASALWVRGLTQRLLPFVLLAVLWATQRYLDGLADAQYLFWSLGGAALLYFCLAEGLRGALPLLREPRDEAAGESLFLFAWLCAPLLFSVIFVPFQAVRHLLPALLPMVLLALRALERDAESAAAVPARLRRFGLPALLALQTAVAFVVAAADYEHADVYRRFAEQTQSAGKPGQTWFIGHWGWFFYGRRAGMSALYPDGPYPKSGDRVVQPVNYYNGALPEPGRRPGGPPRLDQVDVVTFQRRIPLRAMHPAGAGFYAMYSRRDRQLPNLPYRLLPDYPLESFQIYVAR